MSTDSDLGYVFTFGDGWKIEIGAVDRKLQIGCEDCTGFDFWEPATRAACNALLSRAPSVKGRRVLELGCGLGVLGILCAKLGAAEVTLTDKEEAVLDVAKRNATRNGVSNICRFRVLNFAEKGRSNSWAAPLFDIVVASDVLFFDYMGPLLFATLQSLCLEEECTIVRPMDAIIGHEVRRAVYRDECGEPRLEKDDSALESFVQAAGPTLVAKLQSTTSRPKREAEGDDFGQGVEALALLLHWPVSTCPPHKRSRNEPSSC